MASIAKDKNGNRRILFVAPEGSRKTIRLGKVSQRMAEGFKLRAEALLAAKVTGQPMDADTIRWVAELSPILAGRLARVGLIPKPEARAGLTLGEHLANYFARRTDVKPNTLVHWRHTRRCLLAYFGADCSLASIKAGEARDWERWLKTAAARENRYSERGADEGLAVNTIRKRVSNAKQFFQDAVSRDLIAKNPFAGMKGTVGSNRERDYFIDRPTADKVLDACPDAQWRLLFALSRYAGLRCPSEHLALTWGDINWAAGRMLIRSAKTEHHEGKGSRVVPIFPELRPYLERAWDDAELGAEYVITRYRTANTNLRTQLKRIIRQAGLVPWPKLFHNLRASRATELANEYPAHVAAAWLGHSTIVANRHYWQVTEADFAKAVKPREPSDTEPRETSGTEAAQNAAQYAHAEGCSEQQAAPHAQEESPGLPGFASECSGLLPRSVGGTGLEPVTSTV